MKTSKLANRAKARLDEDGRILLPSAFREALGLRAGDTVIVALEGGELRLWSLERGIERAQEMVRPYATAGTSLVDELIAERHAEAGRE